MLDVIGFGGEAWFSEWIDLTYSANIFLASSFGTWV